METILAIENLQKIYPNGTHALKGISLTVQKGEFLVVIGLSGSGKSTLLRCINRLHEPTSGKILYKGADVTHIKSEELRGYRKRIGMIFQHFNLLESRNVRGNIAFALEVAGWKNKKDINKLNVELARIKENLISIKSLKN